MNLTYLVVNLVLAGWLLLSAVVVPQGSVTAWNSMGVALALAAVAFLAYSAPGRPGVRFVNTVLAAWLLSSVMLLPGVTLSSMVNDILVALAVAVASLIPPHDWARSQALPFGSRARFGAD